MLASLFFYLEVSATFTRDIMRGIKQMSLVFFLFGSFDGFIF